jgi:N-methylhydantoinase B/oxoprolinase/acetone carboxylase alpha subunit
VTGVQTCALPISGGNFLNGQPVPDKVPLVLRTGDVLRFEVPGSGGMYPARERDPEAVRQDVENGIVTPEAAAREYGVVLNPETSAGVRATGRRSVHAGE